LQQDKEASGICPISSSQAQTGVEEDFEKAFQKLLPVIDADFQLLIQADK